jgi:hypothetical protein
MTLEQCESFDGMSNARCCFHKGHSGDHFHSREDESDRIRWKIAADERDQLRVALAAMTAARDEACDIAEDWARSAYLSDDTDIADHAKDSERIAELRRVGS